MRATGSLYFERMAARLTAEPWPELAPGAKIFLLKENGDVTATFTATKLPARRNTHGLRSILAPYSRNQVDDQRVDFAQVFATAFFRFQFAIANNNRQITDLVQHFPRHLFDRSV